jgi:hypothetical protein
MEDNVAPLNTHALAARAASEEILLDRIFIRANCPREVSLSHI